MYDMAQILIEKYEDLTLRQQQQLRHAMEAVAKWSLPLSVYPPCLYLLFILDVTFLLLRRSPHVADSANESGAVG